MMAAALSIAKGTLEQVREHLFGSGAKREEGGFLFCSEQEEAEDVLFSTQEWLPLLPKHYTVHEVDYLELTDEARASIIKRAHDAKACLVEVHSHPGPWLACFSPADIQGLGQFVPHVRWRLKRRPYGALVFAESGFDGLAWIGTSKQAVAVERIRTEDDALCATGLTLQRFGSIQHD